MKILSIFKAFLLTTLISFSSLKSLIPCIEVMKRGDQTLILLHDAHVINYAGQLYENKSASKELLNLKEEMLALELNQPVQIIKSIINSEISKDEFIVFNEIKSHESKQFSSPWLKWLNSYRPKSNFKGCIQTFNYLLEQNNFPKKNLDFRVFLRSALERPLKEISSHKSSIDKLNKYYAVTITNATQKLWPTYEELLKIQHDLFNAILLKNIETCKSKFIFAHFGNDHLEAISPFLEEIGFKKIDRIGNCKNFDEVWNDFLTSKKGEKMLSLNKNKDKIDKIVNEIMNEFIIIYFNHAKQLDIYNFLMKHLAPEKQLRSKL